MKVTVDNTKSSKPFPKLMLNKDGKTVFFFIRSGCGLPLNENGIKWDHGQTISSGWEMNSFTDFHGSITLSND